MEVESENLSILNEPYVDEYISAFKEIAKSGQFVLGKNVSAFEEEFSDSIGAKHCVGVASGLDALEIAFQCSSLQKGDEVIVAANSYYACVISIINSGLVPVLVEPDDTLNMDISAVKAAITSKTRGILAVHMYGCPCAMDQLQSICSDHNILLFEDCAQAHNAQFEEKFVGTFGDFAAFSFYPTKNLGAIGEAGAVICKTKEDKIKVQMYRNYGFKKKYFASHTGRNARLDEVQAAFLRIKLRNLQNITAKKKQLAETYRFKLDSLTEVTLPKVPGNVSHVNHLFPILVSANSRDKLRDYLAKNGISSDIHYPIPPHKQEALEGKFAESYPITERLSNEIMSLPISAINTITEIEYVCKKIKEYFEQ